MNSNIFANNIGDLSIARDEEGKVLIFSDLKCCHRFEKSFLAWLRANGLGKVLRNDDIDVPVRPLRAIARQLNGNPKHGDKHKIKDWEHKNDRWESLCEKTLAVLKRALDNPVKEYLRGVITDLDLATRENIRLILQEITNRYGGYSQEKAELNFHMMRTIPNFTSVSTTNNGLQRMSELIEDRIAYRVKEEEWTDKQMRGFLLSKCREWQELSFEVGMIDRQPDMKYTEAKSAILQTVNRLANSAIVESIQAGKWPHVLILYMRVKGLWTTWVTRICRILQSNHQRMLGLEQQRQCNMSAVRKIATTAMFQDTLLEIARNYGVRNAGNNGRQQINQDIIFVEIVLKRL